MLESYVKLERNSSRKSDASLFIPSKSACFHRYILRFFGFCLIGCSELSIDTISWSLIPLNTDVFEMRDGLLVKNRSNTLSPLVGEETICSIPQANAMSRIHWLTEDLYWCDIRSFVSQLRSGRLKSPPIQTVLFLYFLEITFICVASCSAYTLLCTVECAPCTLSAQLVQYS